MSAVLAVIIAATFPLSPPSWALDGSKQAEKEEQPAGKPAEEAESVFEFLLLSYDADGDGQIARKEYTRDDAHWERLDVTQDGVLTEADFVSSGRRGWRGRSGRPGYTPGARVTPPVRGQQAPDFVLEVVVPKQAATVGKGQAKTKRKEPAKPKPIKLSDFARRKRPVALIFGSYT